MIHLSIYFHSVSQVSGVLWILASLVAKKDNGFWTTDHWAWRFRFSITWWLGLWLPVHAVYADEVERCYIGGQSLTYEFNDCCLILVHGLTVNVENESWALESLVEI